MSTRERPILFSGPMVRAILDGRKTQTRRVVTPQPPEDDSPRAVGFFSPIVVDRHGEEVPGNEVFGAWGHEWSRRCPFGAPGDRLWVRESWAESEDQFGGSHLVFRADMKASLIGADGDGRVRGALKYRLLYEPKARSDDPDEQQWTDPESWRPSIHMPRWASRISLEVVRVRVERVQEISEHDAFEEGAVARPEPGVHMAKGASIAFFGSLWNRLNAKRGFGWNANPWVWVVEFKRVESSAPSAASALNASSGATP